MPKQTTADIEKRIADAAEKLKQERNRLKQLKARQTARSRKDRTRKLIVIGAVVLAKAEKEEEFKTRLMQWLDEGVTAVRDRALFNLHPRSKLQPDLSEPQPKLPAGQEPQ